VYDFRSIRIVLNVGLMCLTGLLSACGNPLTGSNTSMMYDYHSIGLVTPGKFNLSAIPGPAQITLTWNSSENASHYEIQYRLINASSFTTYSSHAISPFIFPGLDPTKQYEFKVIAINDHGQWVSNLQTAQAEIDPNTGVSNLELLGSYDSTLKAGANFNSAPSFELKNIYGNTVTNSTAAIELRFYSNSVCSNPVSTLNLAQTPNVLGPLTVTPVGGFVVFNGVSLTLSAPNIYFRAKQDTVFSNCIGPIQITPTTVSNSTSVLAIDQTSITAGNHAQLTLTLKDEYGNHNPLPALSPSQLQLMASSSNGGSGIISALTDLGVGIFTADFQGAQAGSIVINSKNQGVTIGNDVNLSVSSGNATTLVLSGVPASSTAGSPFNATVTAKDALNNTASTYSGNLTLKGYSDSTCSSEVASSIIGSPSNTAGVVSFSGMKILKTNVVAIKASDGTLATTCYTGFVVNPGDLSSLVFSTQPSSNVNSGTSFNTQPTVTAYDVNSNPLATATPITLTLTSGSPTLACNTNPVFTNGNGVATFEDCKLSGAIGTYSLTATSGVKTVISNSIVLSAGSATQLVLSSIPTSVTAGESFNFTVTAKDASGNTATGYSGTVAITSNDPAATLPTSTTLTNGVGSFAVTLRTVGSKNVTATPVNPIPAVTSNQITVNSSSNPINDAVIFVDAAQKDNPAINIASPTELLSDAIIFQSGTPNSFIINSDQVCGLNDWGINFLQGATFTTGISFNIWMKLPSGYTSDVGYEIFRAIDYSNHDSVEASIYQDELNITVSKDGTEGKTIHFFTIDTISLFMDQWVNLGFNATSNHIDVYRNGEKITHRGITTGSGITPRATNNFTFQSFFYQGGSDGALSPGPIQYSRMSAYKRLLTPAEFQYEYNHQYSRFGLPP